MAFLIYIAISAWQDGRKRAVSGWVFLFFFAHFLTAQICRCYYNVDWERQPAAVWFRQMELDVTSLYLWAGSLIGISLLLLSRFTDGAVGEGDGLFFLVSGIYLGFWRNLFLLCSALVFCSFAGLMYLVRGQMQGRNCRKKKLPFLVFTVPAGIFLICG